MKQQFQVPVPAGVDPFAYVSDFATADIECTIAGDVATVTAATGTFVCPTAVEVAYIDTTIVAQATV
jgi:hypothetical protein